MDDAYMYQTLFEKSKTRHGDTHSEEQLLGRLTQEEPKFEDCLGRTAMSRLAYNSVRPHVKNVKKLRRR